MSDLASHASLFAASLLAATLLPTSSEALLAALIARSPDALVSLLGVATLGNTLGAAINWALGRGLLRLHQRRGGTRGAALLARAEVLFQRYGLWSLLFAWLPVIGDPLTFIAGVLRVRLLPFVLLVAVGKAVRYTVVAYGTLWLIA